MAREWTSSRHSPDTLQGVAQGTQGPIADGGVEILMPQEVDARLGRAQPVAQLVRQLAAEAAQEARSLPAVRNPSSRKVVAVMVVMAVRDR